MEFPTPWRLTFTKRKRKSGERNVYIRAADNAYIAERVTNEKVARRIVDTINDFAPHLVDRYGADQWRRGNAGKDPQEFDEWCKENSHLSYK